MVVQGEDLRQKEEQTDGQDDEEYSDSCKPGVERTRIHLCEGSRPLESRQDEKVKSWSGSHELGQSDDEMERLSKMVVSLQ